MQALDEQRLVSSIAPGVMSVDTGGEFARSLISGAVLQVGGTWNQWFTVVHRNSPPVLHEASLTLRPENGGDFQESITIAICPELVSRRDLNRERVRPATVHKANNALLVDG